MLSEIVDKALTKISRRYRSWYIEPSDLRQEAWVAILEAQESGILEARSLEMEVIRHLRKLMNAELRRREFPAEYMLRR